VGGRKKTGPKPPGGGTDLQDEATQNQWKQRTGPKESGEEEECADIMRLAAWVWFIAVLQVPLIRNTNVTQR